jgi:hypothetical protein
VNPDSARGPLIPVLFFLVPLLAAATPRFTPFLLLLLALVLIVAGLRRGLHWRAFIEPNAAMLALIAVGFYAALSAAWAVDPGAALAAGALLIAVTVTVFAAAAAIPSLDKGQVRRASLAFVAGTCCAALFVTIELLTHGALTRGVMNAVPILQPHDTKRVDIEGGRVTGMKLAELNQNVTIVAFLLWPGLLALSTLLQGSRRKLLCGLFFLGIAVPIFLSEHDSSQIGVIASALILPLAWADARAVIRGLALAWCLGFVLVLPLDFLAYKAGLHRADWLPNSARARIVIWEYTAERVLERPFSASAPIRPRRRRRRSRLEQRSRKVSCKRARPGTTRITFSCKAGTSLACWARSLRRSRAPRPHCASCSCRSPRNPMVPPPSRSSSSSPPSPGACGRRG